MAEVAGKGGSVAEEKNLPYHVIQTHIILNDWPGHTLINKRERGLFPSLIYCEEKNLPFHVIPDPDPLT
jgi:hypothetical protein